MSSSIEDNDSRVKFNGQWKRVVNTAASGGTYMSTIQPQAFLTIAFTGTQATVICFTGRGDAGALFSIDNGPPQQVNHRPDTNQQPCWSSPPLLPGTHVLTITNRANGELIFDRMDFTPSKVDPPPSDPFPTPPGTIVPIPTSIPPNTPTPSTPSTDTLQSPSVIGASSTDVTIPVRQSTIVANALPTTTQTFLASIGVGSPSGSGFSSDLSIQTSFGTNTLNLNPTQTPNSGIVNSAPSSSNPEASKARIVGGVLGTLLALLLIAIATYLVLKRRKKKQYLESEIHAPYAEGYETADYQNLRTPNTRAHNPTSVITPYTAAPTWRHTQTSNQWQPAQHQHNTQRSRPASFSSSMYTDGPPLQAS